MKHLHHRHNWLAKGFSFFVSDNIWIAFAAFAFYQSTFLQQGLEIQLRPQDLFPFFATWFLYSLFQLLGDVSTFFSKSTGNKRKQFLLILLASISICCAFFFNTTQWIILGAAAVISSVYLLRFRMLWWLKTPFVTLTWVLICILLPLVDARTSSFDISWMYIIEKYAFIAALTIPYDIKDIQRDRTNPNIMTTPIRFGIKYTRLLAILHLSIGILISFVLYDDYVVVSLFPVYGFAAATIFYVNEKVHEYWFTFVLDGMIVLYFLAVWLSIHIPLFVNS